MPYYNNEDKSLIVLERTRGHMVVQFSGRKIKIMGEMLIPGPGLNNYVVWIDSIERWGENADAEKVSSLERNSLIEALKKWSIDNNYPLGFD